MLKQALALWRQEKQQKHKGTTLQRRLILFFVLVTVSIVLLFAILLSLFGLNGSGHHAVYSYMQNELADISEDCEDNFGRLSLLGISLAEVLSDSCSEFFEENGIGADELALHPDALEPLLAEQCQTLLSVINNNTCSGVYMLLDATINPEAENAEVAKAGIFIKRTLPLEVQSVGVGCHYLRGPAQVGRANGIQLLGQWRMEFDIAGQEFFTEVMEHARENPSLPISRLYYWTGRTLLKDNSEAGFLLCVPLRTKSGAVFGVCGIEVSDRMFKTLYSPTDSAYPAVFSIAAPIRAGRLHAEQGLIAGNTYLSAMHIKHTLTVGEDHGFVIFAAGDTAFGGLAAEFRLYPSDSVYRAEEWAVAVILPQEALESAVRGNTIYLTLIIVGLLALSLLASFLVSRKFLLPVTRALHSIKNETYAEGPVDGSYAEITNLFEFLAQKDKENEERLQALDRQMQDAQSEYARAQELLSRIADERRQQIDPDNFELFLENLETLTPKEREIFGLYLDGLSTKEILAEANINENTLKYHNRNIYGKLGVSSRKELLLYAELMKK